MSSLSIIDKHNANSPSQKKNPYLTYLSIITGDTIRHNIAQMTSTIRPMSPFTNGGCMDQVKIDEEIETKPNGQLTS